MTAKTYPRCKDSGVKWFNDVPSHWTVTQIKRRVATGAGSGFPYEYQDEREEEIPFLKVNALARADADGVIRWRQETVSRTSAASLRATIFPAGSLVIAKIGAALLLGRVRIIEVDSCIDNNMMALTPRDGTNARFLFYAMTLVRFDWLVNPGAVPSTSEGAVGQFPLPFPPRDEQAQIADYLDAQTAKIDALIGKQEQLIETLAERRQAVISHAVTKGLDPNTPMRNSGVDWLGAIPESWTASRLKHWAAVQSGLTLGKIVPFDEGIELPYLRVANVQTSGVNLDEVKTVLVDRTEWTKYRLRDGDVLMTEGGDIDKLGRGCLWSNEIDPCVHQNHVFAVRCGRRIHSRLLVYLLDAQVARSYFRMTAKKTTNLASTNSTTLGNLPLALPDISEQERIVEYLDRETVKIDALSAKAREMIDVLKERRQALISAAVTGKIDVRGLV